MTGIFNRFTEDQKGNVAITGTLLILPILMLAGIVIDYSRISSAERVLESTIDNATFDSQRLFKLGPKAEKELEAFINANTGRDTAKVQISIHQDKLKIEASDEIDTPLLSTIGQAKSEVTASVEVDGNRSTATQDGKSASSGKTKQQDAADRARQREQLEALESGLEKALKRVRQNTRISLRLRQRFEEDLRAQLRIVRNRIRSL